MRHIVGSLGALLAVAALAGCSPSSGAKSANDVFAAMDKELSHTVTVQDDSTEAVGTTSLTNAVFVNRIPVLAQSMPLPESRMSIANPEPDETETVAQTWGNAGETDPNEIPDTRW